MNATRRGKIVALFGVSAAIATMGACQCLKIRAAGQSEVAPLVAEVQRRIEPVKQDRPVWCWAACAQMVHAYHGVTITQEELAARIHGEDTADANDIERARAAAYTEIMLALNPDMPSLTEHAKEQLRRASRQALDGQRTRVSFDLGAMLRSQLERDAVDGDALIEEVSRSPLVAVLKETYPDAEGMEHAYVVDRVMYQPPGFAESLVRHGVKSSSGEDLPISRNRIVSVRAIDPMTGERVEIPVDEFKARVKLLITKRSSEATIRRQLELFTIE